MGLGRCQGDLRVGQLGRSGIACRVAVDAYLPWLVRCGDPISPVTPICSWRSPDVRLPNSLSNMLASVVVDLRICTSLPPARTHLPVPFNTRSSSPADEQSAIDGDDSGC